MQYPIGFIKQKPEWFKIKKYFNVIHNTDKRKSYNHLNGCKLFLKYNNVVNLNALNLKPKLEKN